MQFKVGSVLIDIDLSNGVYALDDDGATGKSYLYKLLLAYSRINQKVLALSYNANWNVNNYVKVLNQNKYQLVILDRYDMYCSVEISKVLYAMEEDVVVLVDVKDWNKLSFCPNMAEVDLEVGRINVSE